MNQSKIPLYLITGFLGSGKTTLMKKLLEQLLGKKIAVIMNEYGSKGVDGVALGSDGFHLSEINEGSVFCACKSDAFIDAIWAVCEKEVDVLLVETSGMANPASIPSILSEVRKKTDRIEYRGCITVAAANNIHKLIQTSLFVQGQVKTADLILLNKIDLVSPDELLCRENLIREWNPACEIFRTSYCGLPDMQRLLSVCPRTLFASNTPVHQIAGSSATKSFLLELKKPLEKTDLMAFLKAFADDVYRIKGFVSLQGGKTCRVDGVGTSIELEPHSAPPGNFLVFIYPDDKPMHHIIQKKFNYCFA